MFSLLTRRDFLLLFAAHTVSILGDYVFFIAMTFWVYARTGSSLAVGAILIASGLPITLIAPLAGRVVDRWRRTTVMIGAEANRAILFLSLLVMLLVWPTSLWPLYAVSCLQSFIAAFFWAARGAILPGMMDEAALEPANALYQFCDGVVRIVAPSLAAVVLLAFSAAGVTAFDAATFLISASCLALLATTPLHPAKRLLPPREATSAAPGELPTRASAPATALRMPFALVALIWFVAGTFSVTLPILAKQQLAAGPAIYGAMLAAQATGEVGASMWLGRTRKRLMSGKTLIGWLVAGGLALGSLPSVRSAILALALNLCIGAASGALLIHLYTHIQRQSDASRIGHRLATFAAIQAFAQLSGIGLASLSASSIGAVRLLILDGLLYMGATCCIGVARGAKDEA